MGVSVNRKLDQLQRRRNELHQRAAWAEGKERMQLFEKISSVDDQIREIMGRR